MMKYYPIKKFGTKLMASSKAINTIPQEYLRYSENARIYDWWIWPRKGKQILTDSTLWTNNKGGFVINDKLYQIANGKIYEINETTWVQTEKATLWYDARTDVLVYDYVIEDFTSLWNEIHNYSYWANPVSRIQYNWNLNTIELYYYNWVSYEIRDSISLTNSNLWKYRPSIKLNPLWTTNWQNSWTWSIEWSWYILENWEYMNLSSAILSWSIDVDVWYYTVIKNSRALIWSYWEPVKVFDWTSIYTPIYQPVNNWIVEFCRWFTFLASWNILYISKPITKDNPNNAYDWLNEWSQNIAYDAEIIWLKATMNWLYVFTTEKIEFIWSNALQNVSWSATFISTTLWDWWELISNDLVTASWDKIFYVTKNLNINTINYIQWTAEPWLWELSNKPVVWIRELLQWIDIDQPNWYAFINDNDSTVQFHLRTINSPFNNICITYDLINDTWNIDTGKNYNYIVKKWEKYYGFSDVNTSVYQDDVWNSDNWVAIRFLIKTQSLNLWSIQQKIFGWFFTTWAIWQLSSLTYRVNIDKEWVFEDSIDWETSDISWIWEIAGNAIWINPIAWNLWLRLSLKPFDFEADVGRIYQGWIRADIEIESQSQIQDFIIDWLWVIAELTPFTDIKNKF